MAVNLSPYGGVGAQFLDNAGNVLTGGKIFTYAGGTTTPQATYTSSNGATPHPNPIILDAAGRVPGGEIWLTDGLVYKFILRDANDVLIATYDGITGINSNFVAFTNQQEIQTATAGQTVFNLTTMTYQPGTNSLSVFVDGVNQYGPGAQYAYLETDSDTVTFVNGLHVGAEVKFTTSQLNSSASQSDAFQVSYVPPFTGSAATNVGLKLAQTVSVKDFGAVGDGVTDDTTAIQAAIAAASCVYFPAGNYLCNFTVKASSYLYGDGNGSTILTGFTAAPVISNSAGTIDAALVFIKDMRVIAEASHTGFAIDLRGNQNSPFTGPRYGGIDNVYVISAAGAGVRIERCWAVEINKLRVSTFKTSLEILNGCNSINVVNSQLNGSTNPAGVSLVDANVRVFGSPTEHTSVRFEGCTFENAYAQSIYALNVQGLQIINNYFENEPTTIAVQEIQLEQCPSAIISGNRVRMRTGVFDFILDNTSSTSLLFSSGKLTIKNNILASATNRMGVFAPIGATASQTTAVVENNSSNWPMFGPSFALVGRQPRVRVSDYLLVMPQHNARYTSPGSTAVMPTDSINDGWYVKKAEWVVDVTYTGGTANALRLEKRWAGAFVSSLVSGVYTLSLPAYRGSPFYQAAYKVELTTTGTLPSPLSTGTDYYVVPVGANSFQLATSDANAKAGTFIPITNTGSGTHTITIYGLISSGSTTVPVNGTAGDRITVSLLSDGTNPSYKTGILSFGEYLYGFSNGGGSVDEFGHWEVTLSRFPSA